MGSGVIEGLAVVGARLVREFEDRPEEEVIRCVEESAADLTRNARITAYIPILAERAARRRLKESLGREPVSVS